MIQLDPTQQLQVDKLELVICKVLRHVFYASYDRAFGQPTGEIRAKIDQADAQTLVEWLPNFVNATKDRDLFVSSFEYAFAQFSSSLIARKFDIQSGPVHNLADISEVLQRHNSDNTAKP